MDTEESQVPSQPAPQHQGLLRAQSTKTMLSKRTSQGRDSVFFTFQFFTKTCVLRKPRSRKSIAGRGRHSDSARNRKLWTVRSTLLIKWFIYGNILYPNMIQTCQKDQEPMHQFQEWMLGTINASNISVLSPNEDLCRKAVHMPMTKAERRHLDTWFRQLD